MSNKKKNNPENQVRQDPYSVDKLAKISPRLKIGFLKFWLAGMSFYFTFMGLPQLFDYLDRLVLWGLLMILGVEYLSNPIIYWMNTDQSNTLKFLPHRVKRKTFLSLLATAGYVVVMIGLTHFFIDLWVTFGMPTIGDLISESTVDPFSFALVFLLFDLIWRQVISLIKRLFKKKV